MTIDFEENGRLDFIRKEVTDFLDQQTFVFPEFASQIAGLRGGVVGLCIGATLDAVGVIKGHLFCDGSMMESNLEVNLTGLKPTPLMVARALQKASGLLDATPEPELVP